MLSKTIAELEVDSRLQRDNEPVCRFCGRLRTKSGYGPVEYYGACSCKEAQAAEATFRSEWDKLHALKIERGNCERQIEWYAQRAERLYKESGLGRRFKERTFESFKTRGYEVQFLKAYEFAKNFKANQGGGLLFAGTVGTGKTHLAAGIANYIITEHGIPVIVSNVPELFGKLRDFSTSDSLMKELRRIPLLILDDIGKEKVTDWNREKLYEIVNTRYEDYLPLVITSNDTPREMEKNLGCATYSRLCEMCELVTMTGSDWRRQ